MLFFHTVCTFSEITKGNITVGLYLVLTSWGVFFLNHLVAYIGEVIYQPANVEKSESELNPGKRS